MLTSRPQLRCSIAPFNSVMTRRGRNSSRRRCSRKFVLGTDAQTSRYCSSRKLCRRQRNCPRLNRRLCLKSSWHNFDRVPVCVSRDVVSSQSSTHTGDRSGAIAGPTKAIALHAAEPALLFFRGRWQISTKGVTHQFRLTQCTTFRICLTTCRERASCISFGSSAPLPNAATLRLNAARPDVESESWQTRLRKTQTKRDSRCQSYWPLWEISYSSALVP